MSTSKLVRSPSPTGSVRSSTPNPTLGTSGYSTLSFNGDKKDDLKVEYYYGDKAKLGIFLVQLKTVFVL